MEKEVPQITKTGIFLCHAAHAKVNLCVCVFIVISVTQKVMLWFYVLA